MAAQIGNNPLDRVQQPQNQPLDDAQGSDIQRVGTGFGAKDSSSLNKDGTLPVALQPKKLSLSQPDAAVLKGLKPGAIEHQEVKGEVGRINSDLAWVSTAISEDPQLAGNQQLQGKIDTLSTTLQSIEGGNPAIIKAIGNTVSELKALAESGNLTEGKLEELLSQLQTKLQDNSLKFNEQTIKSAQDTKQQKHEEALAKYEKHAEGKSLFDFSHLSPGQKAGVILAMIFMPVAAPAIAAAAQAITGGADSPAGFNPVNAAKAGRLDALGVQAGLKAEGASGSSDSRAANAYEGLDLARTGLSHTAMMKLLTQQQGTEEQKEKLEKALQALQAIQAGDIESAVELIGSDFSSVDAFSGEELTPQQAAEGRSGVFELHARVSQLVAAAKKDELATQSQVRRFG